MTTDDEGCFQGTIHVPAEWAGTWVWARPVERGWKRWKCQWSPKSYTATRPKELTVRRGGTLAGSVRSLDETPVEGAFVWLVSDGVAASSSRVSSTGRFRVSYDDAGTYELYARARGAGYVRVPGLALDPLVEPAEIQLEVQGGVPLTGRLVDPAGEPFPNLRILAVWAGPDPVPLEAAPCVRTEQADGLVGDLATTDDQGRFRLPALVPGPYALHALWHGPLRPGHPIKPGGSEPLGVVEVAGEAQDIDFVLREHRVEVRVVDQAGRPVEFLERDGAWCIRPGPVSIHRLEDGRVVDDWSLGLSRTHRGGALVVRVESDVDYLVSFEGPDQPYAEVMVHVPQERFRIPVVVRLRPEAERGELDLQVLAPHGVAFPGPTVLVASKDTGRLLLGGLRPDDRSTTSDPPPYRIPLPPGSYVVRASCEPHDGCTASSPLDRAPHRPVTTEVEIRAGESETVCMTLVPAGHLDLESTEERGALAAWVREGAPPEARTRPPDRHSARGGSASLVSTDGRRVEGLAFELHDDPQERHDWIAPGRTARCLDPLPPGRWTLWIEEGGGLLFERDITIEAGRAAVVRW